MKQVIASHPDPVVDIRAIVERGSQAHIFHSRTIMPFLKIDLPALIRRRDKSILLLDYMRTIAGIPSGERGKQFPVDQVVPSGRPDQVTPTPAEVPVLAMYVFRVFTVAVTVASHVKTQIGTAAVRKRIIDFGVEMVSAFHVDIGLLIHSRHGRPGNQFHPGTPYRDVEGRAVLDDRPLDIGTRSQQADRDIPVIFFPVPLIRTHIYNGRKPPAVFRRKTSFIKSGILHGIRIESRKET